MHSLMSVEVIMMDTV